MKNLTNGKNVIVCVLMALVLILSCMSGCTAADGAISDNDVPAVETRPAVSNVPMTDADKELAREYAFRWKDEGFEICKYLGEDTEIAIPDTYNGEPVIAVAAEAFANNETLLSVTLPDSIKYIGERAFYRCTSLVEVNVPSGVEMIEAQTFADCYALEFVNIPDGVISIGGYAFSNCHALTAITIPESVTSMGAGAFGWCTSLVVANIPSGVTVLQEGVFGGCWELAEITIPDGVTSIGDSAFGACDIKEITIPESVETIGPEAFGWCSITVNAPHSADYYNYDFNYTDEFGNMANTLIKWNVVE